MSPFKLENVLFFFFVIFLFNCSTYFLILHPSTFLFNYFCLHFQQHGRTHNEQSSVHPKFAEVFLFFLKFVTAIKTRKAKIRTNLIASVPKQDQNIQEFKKEERKETKNDI